MRRLESIGIDVVGVTDGADWQAVWPGCRSVVVFASGGPALWEAWLAHLATAPDELERADPLDTFVRDSLEQGLRGAADPEVRWVRCAGDDLPLDFRRLGLEAGLGWRSRLGLLLHPRHGPWLSLRAAAFTRLDLPRSGPLRTPGPCSTCPAPCERACPAGAVSGEGWDARRCLGWQATSTSCRGGCLAREACPVGAEARYGAAQHAYHHAHDRHVVRAALRERA